MGFMELIGDKWWILVAIGVFLAFFALFSEIARRSEKRKALKAEAGEAAQKEKQIGAHSSKAA